MALFMHELEALLCLSVGLKGKYMLLKIVAETDFAQGRQAYRGVNQQGREYCLFLIIYLVFQVTFITTSARAGGEGDVNKDPSSAAVETLANEIKDAANQPNNQPNDKYSIEIRFGKNSYEIVPSQGEVAQALELLFESGGQAAIDEFLEKRQELLETFTHGFSFYLLRTKQKVAQVIDKIQSVSGNIAKSIWVPGGSYKTEEIKKEKAPIEGLVLPENKSVVNTTLNAIDSILWKNPREVVAGGVSMRISLLSFAGLGYSKPFQGKEGRVEGWGGGRAFAITTGLVWDENLQKHKVTLGVETRIIKGLMAEAGLAVQFFVGFDTGRGEKKGVINKREGRIYSPEIDVLTYRKSPESVEIGFSPPSLDAFPLAWGIGTGLVAVPLFAQSVFWVASGIFSHGSGEYKQYEISPREMLDKFTEFLLRASAKGKNVVKSFAGLESDLRRIFSSRSKIHANSCLALF